MNLRMTGCTCRIYVNTAFGTADMEVLPAGEPAPAESQLDDYSIAAD